MNADFDDEDFYDSILEDFEDDNLPSKTPQGETETHEASKQIEEIVRQEEERQTEDASYLSSSRQHFTLNNNFTDLRNNRSSQPGTSSQRFHFYSSQTKTPFSEPIQASSSNCSNKSTPLNRLALKIGPKIFRYKVVNIADLPSTSQDHEEAEAPAAFSWQTSLENEHQTDSEPRFTSTQPSTKLHRAVKQSYGCSECSATFPTKSQLMPHLSSHSIHKPFRCCYRDCAKAFTTIDGLRLHEKLHLEGKQYECELCHKAFSRQHNLIMHLRLHQSGRRHFCSLCGKWFRSFVLMYEHQSLCSSRLPGEVPPSEKPLRYKCTYCDKMFHHKRDKQIHERVHTGERPYSCGYCGKGFSQSQALTVHIRLHTGEKPYQCKTCGLSFRDTSALRKHEFNHHCGVP